MKVFMIGGTGLLGSEAAKELIARGKPITILTEREFLQIIKKE